MYMLLLRISSGLDTYFFPNLGVGQPSNNIDLSEIEIYLGMIITFFVAMKKYKNRGEIWSYVSLVLFQDSLEVVLFIFVHFDITGTRNIFKGYKNVWKLKISIQNFERIRIYSLYTQHLSTCHVMSPLYVYREVSFQHISNEVR